MENIQIVSNESDTLPFQCSAKKKKKQNSTAITRRCTNNWNGQIFYSPPMEWNKYAWITIQLNKFIIRAERARSCWFILALPMRHTWLSWRSTYSGIFNTIVCFIYICVDYYTFKTIKTAFRTVAAGDAIRVIIYIIYIWCLLCHLSMFALCAVSYAKISETCIDRLMLHGYEKRRSRVVYKREDL